MYEGGVEPWDVAGREGEATAEARRLADEAASRGCGVPCRDRVLSSFSLLSLSRFSNCSRKSCAQASSYWLAWDPLSRLGSILRSASM